MRSVYSGFGRVAAVVAVPLLVTVVACGTGAGSPPGRGGAAGDAATLRLGHFATVTHATAMVGVETGIFQEALDATRLRVQTFNAGPAAVEALFNGALDAAYLGPNPAINAYAKSRGEAIRIVAGATSGGAALVVKPGISAPGQLKGETLATPQLANTQDVALRHWLKQNGLKADTHGGGDVSIRPQENAQALEAFRAGRIAGAWVPEPWATRLVQEGGGRVLVDERALWPGGQFVTTHLVVRAQFLRDRPGAVRRLLQGHVRATDYVNRYPDEAQRLVNQGIARIAGKPLAEPVMKAAWANLTFTNDPVASSLRGAAAHAAEVGLLERVNLDGIYDLSLLNQVLAEARLPEVQG